jgi:hypothetical protein
MVIVKLCELDKPSLVNCVQVSTPTAHKARTSRVLDLQLMLSRLQAGRDKHNNNLLSGKQTAIIKYLIA